MACVLCAGKAGADDGCLDMVKHDEILRYSLCTDRRILAFPSLLTRKQDLTSTVKAERKRYSCRRLLFYKALITLIKISVYAL